MTSKEKQGFGEWLEKHSTNKQEADNLQKLWDATGAYKSNYQPDVDKGFAMLKTQMNATSRPTGKLISLKPEWLLRIAAGAALVLGAFFVFKMMLKPAAVMDTFTTTGNIQKNLNLADGTAVTLNEESSLIFPQDFSSKERRVNMTGEAFFEVVKDDAKPFVVETPLAEIQVLGTSFNVRSYEDEGLIEVYVKTGKVAVRVKDAGKQVELKPGEKVVYEKKSNRFVVSRDATGNALAWKEGKLFFKEKTFREIFSEIDRQFGISIKANNEKMLDCRYTLTVEKDHIGEDLNSIKIACPVKFTEVAPKQLLVSGTCCE